MDNKTYKFPKQDKPGIDMVIVELENQFGKHALDVHNVIVAVMEENDISLEVKEVRKMLASLAIKLVQEMSYYDF